MDWIVLKTPASLADVGLALGVLYVLRARPWLGAIAAAALLLQPAVFGVSAWWGQYELLYLLPALVAFILTSRGNHTLSAVAMGIAIMVKPQALPFLLPFLAWYLSTGGVVALLRWAAIVGATVVVVWLPFIADGGPLNLLRNIEFYQNGEFASLSYDAWNVWWLVQAAVNAGAAVSDLTPVLGPVTPRLIGLAATAFLSGVIALAVYRSPTERTLALALAAMSLVTFCLLTTMHERYAYGALIFLVLLIGERTVGLLWLLLGLVLSLNMFYAFPVAEQLYLSWIAAVAIIALTVTTVSLVIRAGWPRTQPAPDVETGDLSSALGSA